MVHWMRVGFVRGVMNTDNLSILGLTIDYGPYGWVDNFDPAWTPNTTDAQGRRYCFARQPAIARWNLERLAEALAPLADADELAAGIERYGEVYNAAFARTFAEKFGWVAWDEDDADLVDAAFSLLPARRGRYDDFFRQLARVYVRRRPILPCSTRPSIDPNCRPCIARP